MTELQVCMEFMIYTQHATYQVVHHHQAVQGLQGIPCHLDDLQVPHCPFLQVLPEDQEVHHFPLVQVIQMVQGVPLTQANQQDLDFPFDQGILALLWLQGVQVQVFRVHLKFLTYHLDLFNCCASPTK